MPTVRDIQYFLERRIPKSLSVPGDNDGFAFIPQSFAEVTKIVLALDITLKSIEFAKKEGAQLIVAHHPLIFSPLSSVSDRDAVSLRLMAAAEAGIALAGYHTRLDAITGGVNDTLCRVLQLDVKESFDCKLGRVGTLAVPCNYDVFCRRVSAALGTDLITGVNVGKRVYRVAVVGGSGKGSFYEAYATGADTFLTGEVAHSTLLDARDLGINLVCATHYYTENVVLPSLKEIIQNEFEEMEISLFYDDIHSGQERPR